MAVAGRPNNRVGAFVRGFGEDSDGEIYALTSTLEGTSGATGAVYKLVPADHDPGRGRPAATATPVAAAPTPTAVASAPARVGGDAKRRLQSCFAAR